MTDASPTLLEVVPWNYGFAHSWALAWLAENAASRDAVVGLLARDAAGPYEVETPVDRELPVVGMTERDRRSLRRETLDGRAPERRRVDGCPMGALGTAL